MSTNDIVSLVQGIVLPILGTLVTVFVIPWIKNQAKTAKSAKTQATYDLLATWAETAVTAMGSQELTGPDKKRAAIAVVQKQLDDHKLSVNAENIANAVEAAYAANVGRLSAAYASVLTPAATDAVTGVEAQTVAPLETATTAPTETTPVEVTTPAQTTEQG